eukprot:709445-Pelagomonas_calceolata.AAC.2
MIQDTIAKEVGSIGGLAGSGWARTSGGVGGAQSPHLWQPSFVAWDAAGTVWEHRFHRVLVLAFPGQPPQAPGTAPVDTNFISTLMWMLLNPGPGGGPFQRLRSRTCGAFQLAAEPTGLNCSDCDGIFY